MPAEVGSSACRRLAGRCLLPLLLLMLVSSASADLGSIVGGVASAVKGIFGGGGGSGGGGAGGDSGASDAQHQAGPIKLKAAQALLFAAQGVPGSRLAGAGPSLQVEVGGAANATVLRTGQHSVVVAFQVPGSSGAPAPPAAPAATDGGSSVQVPFLDQFLYTAEAPAPLVEAFDEAAAALADAIEEMMGGAPVLRMLCTGEGPVAGGLALLCAPWAALQFPTANADAITFAATWNGFNTQFRWVFVQLATLHYTWTFGSTDTALSAPLSNATASLADATASLAGALGPLITADALSQAAAVPGLPPELPPDYSPDYFSEQLGSLAPLGPELEPPPSECPVMLCKTRDAVVAACLAWNQSGLQQTLPGVPATPLHSDSGADAVVAWNASTRTGIIVWQGSEQAIDWVQDAIVFFSDDFRPGNLGDVFPKVKVHRGFLTQFASLATNPSSDSENITAVLLGLSGGQAPEHLLISGHSLGAALSELAAVWASTVWPNASVLVANTGAPRVGDAAWEAMFTAVVGRAYRYVNHLDEVPELPPFDSFRQVPHGMWLRDDLVLLQDRPPLKKGLTWNDHHCETLYVPPILNATAVTVPGFIFNATAAAN